VAEVEIDRDGDNNVDVPPVILTPTPEFILPTPTP
jgi:hypothetical protein